jgi:short-subunit dehydrogenase
LCNNIHIDFFIVFKQIAYQYARRGARLALVARREDRLRGVASEAMKMGSPDVIMIRADVSKVEDCKRFVDEAIRHFGQCK